MAAFLTSQDVYLPSKELIMSGEFKFEVTEADVNDYLRGGRWSEAAEDNISGEAIPSDFVRKLVLSYKSEPNSVRPQQGLGLVALLLGIAQWGVTGSDLPNDPAKKDWHSVTGEDSGKHLMSYAVGGVGISHADVEDLKEYVEWVAASDLVPMIYKPALLRLAAIKYAKKGILYDEVRAAGRCSASPGNSDLLGEPFKHFEGPAGSRYCHDYDNSALEEKDWVVFRTWMRASLRTKKGQRYLLELWFRKYWQPTIKQIPGGEGAAEEMIVNVRVRNSSPVVATKSIQRHAPLPGTAGRVQRQIDAYADWKLKTARRRWQIMMRPVVLYRHFSELPPLDGVTCK
jgi:hypothetical protein